MKALLCLLLVGCGASTVVEDPPHRWDVRTSIDREPHAYFFCVNGQHEPRDAAEQWDALNWWQHRTP